MARKSSAAKDSVVEKVETLWAYAQEGVMPLRAKWLERYRYWNAENKIERPQYRDNVRVPLIFMISDGIQAILTDNKPKVEFRPQTEADVDNADRYQQIIGDYYWEELDLFTVAEEIIWWAQNISGSAIAKYGIDPETGEFYVEACNSFAQFPDPSARRLEKCEFYIEASPWNLAEIKRVWPEKGEQVGPDRALMEMKYDTYGVVSPWARSSGKSENIRSVISGKHGTPSSVKDKQKAMVLECWYRDDTKEKIPVPEGEIEAEHAQFVNSGILETSPEENHPAHIRAHKELYNQILADDSIPVVVAETIEAHIAEHEAQDEGEHRMKYPDGKIAWISNGVLLEDKEAMFGLNRVKFDFILNPREFWSNTLQQYIQSLQDSRERRKRQISDNADRMANTREIYNVMSQYDPDSVTNEAGEQVPVVGRPQDSVWTPQVPSMPTYVLEDGRDSELMAEKISGYPEVLQGKYPAGSPSGVAIGEILEALGPRMRKISRHFENWLTGIVRGIMKMLPMEDPAKIMVLAGDDPREKWQFLSVAELGEVGEYRIRIIAGSTLPTSRSAKQKHALEYFQAGLYDLPAALKYSDDPQASEVIERLNVVQEQEKVIQAAMQQIEILKQQLSEATGGIHGQQGLQQGQRQTQNVGSPQTANFG